MNNSRDIFAGVLIGTAVGDALGLPREGLSRRRAAKMWGGAPLRHRFVFGRGMVSDDTEHTCMAAQALIASRGDPRGFARSFSWRLRWWLLALPAGVGSATLRGIVKLWIGFPPGKSGVFSAGNGPAMRAAILGAYCAATHRDAQFLRELVRASTRMTHRDPDAEEGAFAIAVAAWMAVNEPQITSHPTAMLAKVEQLNASGKIRAALATAREHIERGASAEEYADALGLSKGVGGYICHTVPVALFCWLRHPEDFRAALESAILLGGDSDTLGAIVGGLAGLSLGVEAIPMEWKSRIVEWPRSIRWIEELAGRLAESVAKVERSDVRPLFLFWPAILVRNLVFLAVVLFHGFRRLAPPY